MKPRWIEKSWDVNGSKQITDKHKEHWRRKMIISLKKLTREIWLRLRAFKVGSRAWAKCQNGERMR